MRKPGESATQRAYDFIRTRLQNREYRPGTRLVTRHLAKHLGTSLNPIREALNRLSSQGLVEHVPGSGTFVHNPDAHSIRELYGLREAIESHAAAEAASQISKEQIADLKRICDGWRRLAAEMREAGKTQLPASELGNWIESEERFHSILVEGSCNSMLTRLAGENRVLSTIFASQHQIDLIVTAATIDQVIETHCSLIRSIEIGDRESARRQMADMIKIGCRTFLEQIETIPS